MVLDISGKAAKDAAVQYNQQLVAIELAAKRMAMLGRTKRLTLQATRNELLPRSHFLPHPMPHTHPYPHAHSSALTLVRNPASLRQWDPEADLSNGVARWNWRPTRTISARGKGGGKKGEGPGGNVTQLATSVEKVVDMALLPATITMDVLESVGTMSVSTTMQVATWSADTTMNVLNMAGKLVLTGSPYQSPLSSPARNGRKTAKPDGSLGQTKNGHNASTEQHENKNKNKSDNGDSSSGEKDENEASGDAAQQRKEEGVSSKQDGGGGRRSKHTGRRRC